MVKLSLKNKKIGKHEALTDAKETQILRTLIRQGKESVEAFLRREGGRNWRRRSGWRLELIDAGTGGSGTAMQVAQQWIRVAGLRVDGKLVTEIVKEELAN